MVFCQLTLNIGKKTNTVIYILLAVTLCGRMWHATNYRFLKTWHGCKYDDCIIMLTKNGLLKC